MLSWNPPEERAEVCDAGHLWPGLQVAVRCHPQPSQSRHPAQPQTSDRPNRIACSHPQHSPLRWCLFGLRSGLYFILSLFSVQPDELIHISATVCHPALAGHSREVFWPAISSEYLLTEMLWPESFLFIRTLQPTASVVAARVCGNALAGQVRRQGFRDSALKICCPRNVTFHQLSFMLKTNAREFASVTLYAIKDFAIPYVFEYYSRIKLSMK